MTKAQEPDLVILDLNMDGDPDAGYGVLEKLRADIATTHIPIVLSSAEPYHLRECVKTSTAQPNAILDKPFQPQTLIRMVEELLPLLSA